jgi:DNA-binding MarR family transcriptional regulator
MANSKEKLARNIYDVVQQHDEKYSDRPTETIVNIKQQQKRLPLPPSIMVFQKVALLAALQLSDRAIRVLMYFFSISVYENYFSVDQKTITQNLKFSRSTLWRAIEELEGYGIITKYVHPNDNRRIDYFINPHVAWKGNSYARQQALRKIEKETPYQLRLSLDTKTK